MYVLPISDAPLDLKVKSNMVSDLLNLVGVECQDPVTDDGAENKMKMTKIGNHEATSDRHLQDSKTVDRKLKNKLNDEEQRMVSRFKDEFERKGNWVLIFPTETSWDTYSQLLGHRRNNGILHIELFVKNKKKIRNTKKYGYYLDKEAYLFHLAERRCKQYERCLSVLSPSSSTISLKKVSPRILPEGSSQDISVSKKGSQYLRMPLENNSETQAHESEMLGVLKNLSVSQSPQSDAILTERSPQHATPIPPGTENATSAALDDINSSFMSQDDKNMDVRDLTSDEADNINKNVCLPVLSCTMGSRTSLFKFRAEGVVKDLPDHKDIAAKYRLTYKQGNTNCRLIDKLLSGHGFRKTYKKDEDYNLCWMGYYVKPRFFDAMKSFQRVNHFPRSVEITRKDMLYKNVEKMQRANGFKNFDFVPQTFILPAQYNEFLAESYKERCTWIIKPVNLSSGRGIFLTNNPHECLNEYKSVACKYITNPLLINGLKFDIRLYVAVTSFNPLVIYLYEEGLTRFATIPYDKSSTAFSNTCMHLTNYSLNKRSSSFISNKNSEVENEGSKWTLGALLRYLKKEGHDTTSLMLSIEDVIIKTMIAGEIPISASCETFVKFKENCFELFGFDILLDENFKPWVLEVNLSPSLACDAPLDLKVKSNMVSDLLNLVGVECQDPVTDDGAENKMKITKIGNHEATSDRHLQDSKTADRKLRSKLNDEEQRMVSRFKKEFERKGNWVRIFPTETSWDTYNKLLCLRKNSIILHLELFAENRENRRIMKNSGHKDYLDKEAYLFHLAEQRCKQYERCLSVLSPSSSTISLKKVSPRILAEGSSQDISASADIKGSQCSRLPPENKNDAKP